jgi:hypothetical protein
MADDLPPKSGATDEAGGTNTRVASNNDDDAKLRDYYALHDVSVDHVFAVRRPVLGNNNGEQETELSTPKSCHPHRFIRLNPRYDRQETLDLIKVCWLS